MNILIVTGDLSGENHMSSVVKVLLSLYPDLKVSAVGSELLFNAGANVILSNSTFKVMGFSGVLQNLIQLRKSINYIKDYISKSNLDLIICVDSFGLNSRIAKMANLFQVPCIYYIPPKIWAWNQSRVHVVRKHFIKVFTIFPFEASFFQKFNINAVYVGNPSAERVWRWKLIEQKINNSKYIALIPGSRLQEVLAVLPVLYQVAKASPHLHFKVAALKEFSNHYNDLLASLPNIEIVYDDYLGVIGRSQFAIVTSGTASFETALLKIPQIVIYKTSQVTYLIAKYVISIKYISLPNILLNRELVRELIQGACTADCILQELDKLQKDRSYRQSILDGYNDIWQIIGDKSASQTVAEEIYNFLINK